MSREPFDLRIMNGSRASSFGVGAMSSNISSMMCRGVRNWHFRDALSSRFRCFLRKTHLATSEGISAVSSRRQGTTTTVHQG